MILLLIGLAFAGPHVVVKRGDTVAGIAARWGVDEADLRRRNRLQGEPRPGTILDLPGEVDPAVLTNTVGDVRIRLPQAAEVSGRGGDELPAGTVVCTGTDGYATVRLASAPGGVHDEITLLPGTCLTVANTSGRGARRASQVDVAAGSVSVRDAKDDRGDVIVTTQSGVTTGSGGGFRVSVEPGAARTEAVTDPVAVLGAGEQVDVGAGEGSRTKTGAAPGAPVKLLLAPSILAPADRATLSAAVFSWQDNPEALGYHFSVATDAAGVMLVYSNSVDSARWRPTLFELPSEPGAWWWTVESIDRDGFVGLPAVSRCFVAPSGIAMVPGNCAR